MIDSRNSELLQYIIIFQHLKYIFRCESPVCRESLRRSNFPASPNKNGSVPKPPTHALNLGQIGCFQTLKIAGLV